MLLRRTLATLTAISLVTSSLAPLVAQAASAKKTLSPKNEHAVQLTPISTTTAATTRTDVGNADLPVINLKDVKKSNITVRSAGMNSEVRVMKSEVKNPPTPKLYDLTGDGLRRTQRSKPAKKVGFAPLSWLRGLVGGEPVSAATPLIAYYAGIENHDLDYALYYLSNQQNQDGSFGESDQYVTTYYVVTALTEVGRTQNDQYAAAVTYLENTTPQNNRERALKARLLWLENKPYIPLLEEIDATLNKDGGFGYNAGYASDVLTTSDVVLTYYLAKYSFYKTHPLALNYIYNAINQDGEVRYMADGAPSYYLVNRVLQNLLPLKAEGLDYGGQYQISVQSKITALLGFLKNNTDVHTGEQLGASRSIDGILSTRSFYLYDELGAVAALKAKIIAQQSTDGSFGNSIEATAEALTALKYMDARMVSITSIGNLENKVDATFEVTIKNAGYDTIATSSIMAYVDNVLQDWTVTLPGDVNALKPGGTATVQFTFHTYAMTGTSNVRLFLSNQNDRYYDDNWIDKDFVFAPAADNLPAIAPYYIAYSDVLNGKPAVRIQWARKPDAKRKGFMLMLRFAGGGEQDWMKYVVDDSWTGTYLSPLVEGANYEFTLGEVNLAQNMAYRDGYVTSFRASANPQLYTSAVSGIVFDGNGGVPDVSIGGFGVSTTTDANGVFGPLTTGNGTSIAYVSALPYDRLISKFVLPIGQLAWTQLNAHLITDAIAPVFPSLSVYPANNFKVRNQNPVLISAAAFDNAAVKEVYAYLWNPVEEYWSFIGKENAPNYSGALLTWNVPSTLLGKGYKIKAVMYDYRGNNVEKEWGPFEIIDGGISDPAGLTAKPTLNHVMLDWPQYADGFGSFDHFAIYRSQSPINATDGLVPLATVNDVSSTHFVDVSGVPSTTYYYVLTAVSKNNAESLPASALPITYPQYNGVVYEDAEDGQTSRWILLGNQPASIANVADDAEHGRAIEVKVSDLNNQNYELLVDGNKNWGNVTGRTLQFDLKTQVETYAFVALATQQKTYYIMYSFNVPTGMRFGRYVSMHLDPSLKDGQWHTVTRDLQADLATLVPNTPILAVDHFILGSTDARVDNVAVSNVSFTHSISGTITDAQAQPLPNIVVTANPGNYSTITDQNGAYSILGLSDNTYTVSPQDPGYTFAPASTDVVIAAANAQANFVGTSSQSFVYENAEDGSTSRWEAYLGGKPGTISNVVDNDHGKVIEIKLTEPLNQSYTLLSGGQYWHNTKAANIQFDLKTTSEGYYFVRVETQSGYYYLMYSFNFAPGLRLGGKYISINLDPSLKDGQWHTVTRDLQGDLATLVPNTPILSVENFIAESTNTRLDNIMLTNKKNTYGISGVVKNNNQAVAGLTLKLSPGVAMAITGQNGEYSFANLAAGSYTISVDPRGPFQLTPTTTVVTITNNDVVSNLSAGPRRQYIYEDGEGDTSKWLLLGANLPGTSIAAVADAPEYGNVIEIKTPDIQNQNYILQDENHAEWHNTVAKVLQLDLKSQADIRIFVRAETQGKTYYLSYSFDRPEGMYFDKYISIKLDPSLKDGQWHTITRDLQADLNSLVPNVAITSVEDAIVGGTNVRVDNISLRTDVSTHKISGTILGQNNQPVPGVTVTVAPGNHVVVTDNNGAYAVGSLENGTYDVTPTLADYEFMPMTVKAVVNNDDVVTNFTASPQAEYVYEDGEDGSVNRWQLLGINPPGTSITNLADDQAHGRVIEIKNPDAFNANYELFDKDGVSQWNNNKALNISFDFKTQNEIATFVGLQTQQQVYYVMYSFNRPTGMQYGRYVSINLDPSLKDGQWHTVTRNLQDDLASLVPNTPITGVLHFIAGSNDAYLDNIKLVR
jgi:hypothetical protein